jgi:hypothetical protein
MSLVRPVVYSLLAFLYVATAIVLADLGQNDTADFIIRILTSFSVVSAVVLAIYGDQIRELLTPTVLRIEPVTNHDNFTNLNNERGRGNELVITYHLRVTNSNSVRAAKKCTVKLIQILDEDLNRKPIETFRFAVPRSMVWSPAEHDPTEQIVYDSEVFDLGNLYLADGEFRLRYLSSQGGVFDGHCVLGKRRKYVFRMTAEGCRKPAVYSFHLQTRAVVPTPEWNYGFALQIDPA